MPKELLSHRIGVATASLGMNATHTLLLKFRALQRAGFTYCEIGFGEYMAWCRARDSSLPPSSCPLDWKENDEPDPSDEQLWTALYKMAPDLLRESAAYDIQILAIQPLNQFDGWPRDHPRLDWSRRKAQRWLKLCSLLQVQMLQVGANNLLEANASDPERASDLVWLAERGALLEPPVQIAYEQWCFGEHINTCERTWDIVKLGAVALTRKDHPNLGLCLDTGQFPLSPPYGLDPSNGGGFDEVAVDKLLAFLATIPASKIFYLEVSDVLPPLVPLHRGSLYDNWHKETAHGRNDRFTWTLCARSVPFIGRDAGRNISGEGAQGVGRIVEIVRSILETGFTGPVIFEMFEATSMEAEDAIIPDVYAQSCRQSTQLLSKALLESLA